MERSFQIKSPAAPKRIRAKQLSHTGFGTKDDHKHELKH